MKRSFIFLCLLALPAVAEPVTGFEDQVVLDSVMTGTVTVEEVLATDSESTFVIRGFFPKVTPDQYVDLATDHRKYPSMFSEIKEAKTTWVNSERTEWKYWMNIVIKVLFFTKTIYPEGKQVYSRPVNAIGEGVLTHTVENYADTLKTMIERTRLIPYQDGMLVHDYINYILTKSSSSAEMIRSKLREQFVRFLTTYRKVLTND